MLARSSSSNVSGKRTSGKPYLLTMNLLKFQSTDAGYPWSAGWFCSSLATAAEEIQRLFQASWQTVSGINHKEDRCRTKFASLAHPIILSKQT